MKSVLIVVPIALAVGFLSSRIGAQAARPQAAIAYVSSQRIFAETNEGKAAVARAQAFQQQRGTELRSRQQTLESTRLQLAQATDAAARSQLQVQAQNQQTDLERANAQAQTDAQTMQRQVNSDMQARVRGVLADLSKGENFQIVLNSDAAVIWASSAPGLDLTNAVIERMNVSSAPKQ
jgi:Skp family chaperone for outer membrane proteins